MLSVIQSGRENTSDNLHADAVKIRLERLKMSDKECGDFFAAMVGIMAPAVPMAVFFKALDEAEKLVTELRKPL